MSFSFSKTSYRFVSRETKNLLDYTKTCRSYRKENEAQMLFLMEGAICKFTNPALESSILPIETNEELLNTLSWICDQDPSRNDALHINIKPYAASWDKFTSRFFTTDYSREDLSRMTNIFSTFSESIIMRGLQECDPGKPLPYLLKVLERMRAETVPLLRREEMYAQRINMSSPVRIPEFREPGFISNSISEELFFRAIQ